MEKTWVPCHWRVQLTQSSFHLVCTCFHGTCLSTTPVLFTTLSMHLKMSRAHFLIQRIIREAEGYLELGMTQHALNALQRRGKFVHGNARACYLMGEALRELGHFREALFPLERSAELTPDDIHVWLAIGWCYKRTGQLDHAIEALEKALAVDGSEAILHYNLACYWSLSHDRSLAIGYLSQALDIDGNFRDLVLDEPDFLTLHQDPVFKLIAGIIS